MPGLAEAKCPIVQFDHMEYGTDAEASKNAGRPIPKVVPFAFITPDKFTRLEYPAEEWLAKKRNEAIEGRVNPDWVTRWEMQYAAWKKGEELPLDGEPVRTWVALRKDQMLRLINAGVLTIEQMRDANQVTLDQIGQDARNLKDLATKTLESAHSGATLAKEISDLKQQLRDEQVEKQTMRTRLAALENTDKPLGLPKKG